MSAGTAAAQPPRPAHPGLPMSTAAARAALVEDVDGVPPFGAAAVFNPERTHRFCLTRTWGSAGRACTFVMLNPSTADAFTLDPTVRRCLGFAAREGCDSLTVVNLFALRSTDPRALYSHSDPTGGDLNDVMILRAALGAGVVIAAWGVHGTLNERGTAVTRALVDRGVTLHALTITRDGQPGHPLFVRGDAPLLPYRAGDPGALDAARAAAASGGEDR